MFVYLVMFAAAEFFTLFTYKKYVKKKVIVRIGDGIKLRPLDSRNIFYFVSCIPFLLVSVLRYKIGTDYNVYSRLQIPEVMRGDYDRVEFLYRYVIKLGMAMGDVHWVFVITHIIIIAFYWLAMEKSENISWSIFIFMFGCYFNFSLNIMRQFIAMGIALYAVKYISEKKPKTYAVFIIIATLFHTTALLYLILYPLSRYKLNKYAPLTIMAVCFVLSGIARSILSKFTKVFYSSYLDSKYDKMDMQWDFIAYNAALLIVLLVFQLSMEKQYNNQQKSSYEAVSSELSRLIHPKEVTYTEKEEREFRTLIWMQVLACVFSCLSGIIPNSTRIIILMSQGQILLVPVMIKRYKVDKVMQIILKIAIIVLTCLLFYRKIVFGNYGQTLPYQSIFSK